MKFGPSVLRLAKGALLATIFIGAAVAQAPPNLQPTLQTPVAAPVPKQEPAAVAAQQPTQSVIPRQTFCTQEYAPVCGRIGEGSMTYSNACVANAANAEIVASGPCH
jgi:hypothetical protein